VRLIVLLMMICGWIEIGTSSAVAQSATVTVSPGSLSFGVPSVGSTSAAQAVTFSIAGGSGTVTLGTVSRDNPDFTIATDACSGATLTSPAACTVGVTFKPSVTGLENGMLSFPNNFT